MTRRQVATGLGLLGMMLSSGIASAKPRTIEGTVMYRERMALPPNAVVEVRLLDVSLADAPSRTIATTTVRPRGQVPIRYRLRFDDSTIKPRRRYALQAQITVDDRLWFTSTTHHPVFTGGRDQTDIMVQRVAEEPGKDAARSPAGRWLAEDIRGRGVIDNLQTVLVIARDGRVSGTGGCNRLTGSAKISGNRISFGQVASTQMACVPAAMDQEGKFFAALRDVRSWRTDARGKLQLLDARRRPIIVLARM
ncbi:YbaY family lipoprotein [Arvimicrobium flavum]|uniref:YbaY family lipoprotein n=1 Tax=Arvimicrobium flavum TaxID=3393320 RepID=UPI00237C3232|nr:YbaY family lipoprotein [Mesorhizobium shangrilense]